MKTLKAPLVFASMLIVVTILLSWNLFDYDKTGSTSSLLHKDKSIDAARSEFTTGDELSPQNSQPPAAEDVLIQRIPADNGHLLLMAYYSKENYSASYFTIENGSTITLRDDGKGDDKIMFQPSNMVH
jgi:hypothetical protein